MKRTTVWKILYLSAPAINAVILFVLWLLLFQSVPLRVMLVIIGIVVVFTLGKVIARWGCWSERY